MSLRADDRKSSRRERSRSRYDDDEDAQSKVSSSKHKSRSDRYNDDDDAQSKVSSSKHKSRSRRDDDDDDKNGESSRRKHRSSRKYDDEDEEDSSKTKSRSRRHDKDDAEEPSSRSKHRSSRYLEGEDDKSSKSKPSRYDEEAATGEPLSKSRSRARFSDEETLSKTRSPPVEDDDAPRPRSFTGASLRNKAARFRDEEDGGQRGSGGLVSMPDMPGGFEDDDEDHLAYETRQPSSRLPGLSSLFGAGSTNGRGDEHSDDERNDQRSSRRYESEVRSPREDQGRTSKSSRNDDRATEVRRPSRQSVSFGSRDDGIMPYPDADHAFMPSIPTIPGEEPEYRMTLPYGAERPHDDYDEDEDHLTYLARPLGRSRTDSVNDSHDSEVRTPRRSVSYPSPGAEAEKESRRKSSSGGGLLSVGGSKSATRSRSRDGRLSVSTGGDRPSLGGRPPASPLLESYKGTYQSTSPMPSPMMLPQTVEPDTEIEDFSLEERKPTGSALTRKKSIDPKTGKKKVILYDSEGDAEKLAKALNHSSARPEPLIEVLPELTHDQLLALREQYRKRVKVAGRGVNLSKQIKSATTGNFGKVTYVTSLGRWEAESYWANFWYQSHSTSRELLIEALMGKPNAEMREINDSFKDKRYQDNLSLCMEKELKPDKFRNAVLTALEARRQEETDVWPLEYRNRDVEVMARALNSREGGESAILDIVVRRSDNHLRELLKSYERVHRENFARAALAKSNNLVVSLRYFRGVVERG